MIKSFIESWEKNKSNLEEYIRTHKQVEYDSYRILVKLIFDLVINPDVNTYNDNIFVTDEIDVLDHGDYQGTLIFILHRDTYQPCVDEYIYTYVYYGSCSGCDTLQAMHNYDEDEPDENQVEDYMTLCLHLLQHCKCMGEFMEEDDATCDNT
jgi:hypothetical protein